jgi:hypothetical protein
MAFSNKPPITFGKDETERAALGWKSGESITVKASCTTQDIDAIAHADKIGRSTQEMLERFIQSWQLFNDENMPIKLSSHAIALLESEYVGPLAEVIGTITGRKLPKELLENFTSAATTPS